MNSKTEKILLQKFNREFTKKLQDIIEEDKVPMYVNQETFNKLI